MRRKPSELRKDSTEAEQILWQFLRDRKLVRLKFRRQHKVGKYILDYYCAEKKLCIEVDGGIHDQPDQRIRDEQRSKALEGKGIAVLRFQNQEIQENIGRVLTAITDFSQLG